MNSQTPIKQMMTFLCNSESNLESTSSTQFQGKQAMQAIQESAIQDAQNGQTNAAPTYSTNRDLRQALTIFA